MGLHRTKAQAAKGDGSHAGPGGPKFLGVRETEAVAAPPEANLPHHSGAALGSSPLSGGMVEPEGEIVGQAIKSTHSRPRCFDEASANPFRVTPWTWWSSGRPPSLSGQSSTRYALP
ncbi:hypothetical protein E2562_039485 [Oryza meyeriana var. granulata]|uniref:Uncharacterized protein n=1 Tax=Oryza meyeriana var. granulata TaxID=110450 RepID=A0A6G1FH03_9ORYZ|nr:hypothetical protein E2562_039485 [Oryza meyeriana var. granulata]